ncbi:MAG: thioesterase family protein [Planctomycetota bacterium]
MGEVFRTRRLVEFSDTDMAGIAHFSAFFRWMEAAEHEFLRSLGYSIFDKAAEGHAVSFPRVNATCDYRSPAHCVDTLDIEVTVARLGSKSVTYAFHFLRGDQAIADGKMTSVCCKMTAGEPPQPTPIPGDMAESLRPFVVA